MLMIDENHFKAMIGKYVPTERIGDFKKDLISQTFSDDDIEVSNEDFEKGIPHSNLRRAFVDGFDCCKEKLKRRGP